MLQEPVRKHLEALCELLYYANSRDDGEWASQSLFPQHNGVYGHTYSTIQAILSELYGSKVSGRIMDEINFGGGESWFADLEAAIKAVLDYLAYEAECRARAASPRGIES